MELNNNQKTAILVFSASLLAFLFFVKPGLKAPGTKKKHSGNTSSMDGFSESEDITKRQPIKEPTINAKELKKSQVVNDAYTALKTYVAAWNAGEKQSDLNQLVRDLRRSFSVTVYKKADGRIAVCDIKGKDILINDI